MQSVISDCLIKDLIRLEIAAYDFDKDQTYFLITPELEISSDVCVYDGRFLVPQIDFDGVWKTSWRQEPKIMRTALEQLLLKAAANSKHTIKTNNFSNGLQLAARLIGLLTDVPGSQYSFAYGDLRVLCSKEFKLKHMEELSSIFFERRFIAVDGVDNNKLIAMPYQEFVGCLPFTETTFGAFAISDNIVNVEF